MHGTNTYVHGAIPLAFFSPLLVPLCLPFMSPLTYLAPSSCDRNCPPQSQVACKLTPFAHPSPTLPLPSKFPEPHPPSASLRRPREYSGSCYPEQVSSAQLRQLFSFICSATSAVQFHLLSYVNCMFHHYTVRPMSRMHLTSLQKCNRAWWQMLFHPTALTLEFWNPLTSGQIHLSCVFCALPGWNMTQKIHLLLHYWSIPLSPSMQYFILIGRESLLAQPQLIIRNPSTLNIIFTPQSSVFVVPNAEIKDI